MAAVLAPRWYAVPRKIGVAGIGADVSPYAALTINTTRSGSSTEYIIVLVIHDRSGEVVFRKKVKGSVAADLQTGSAITETYTVIGLDPQNTLPPTILDGVTPGESVDVHVQAPTATSGITFG